MTGVLSLKKGIQWVRRFVRMELVYGKRNPAKVTSTKTMLDGLDLQIKDLCSLDHLPTVEESGISPLENAKTKAETYYRLIGKPIFTCDS